MTTKDDGGPAFPHGTPILLADGTYRDGRVGMTLRDWFAGQALAGMMASSHDNSPDWLTNPNGAATEAFAIADAMLAERSK